MNYLDNTVTWVTTPSETQKLQATIQRVRELHKPIDNKYGLESCEACSKLTSMALGYENFVTYAFCPTIQALDGEQK